MHLIRFWIILNELRPSYSVSVVQRDKEHCVRVRIQESTESEEDEKMADRGGGKGAQIKGGTD